MRAAATNTLDKLTGMNISFRMFETYRSPERQAHLARKRPKVTRAGPWQSMHQYGLAVDFVIDCKGVNPWCTKGEYREWWDRLHEVGRHFGLEPLSFEKPHMQLVGQSWRECKRGNWPAGGDEDWVLNIHEAAARFRKGAPKILPDYEEDVLECRPAL